MLAPSKIKLIQEAVNGLSKDELIWLSGYLSGLATAETGLFQTTSPEASLDALAPTVQKITIAYGTETGNSKRLATNFAAKAKKKGIQSKLVSLEQYKLTELAKEEWLFIIISTQGEGEPPAAAKKFYDYVQQNTLALPKLNYGVLALGDTSYPLFCKAGEDVDQRLQSFGGNRVTPLQKLDTDYEEDAERWIENLLQSFSKPSPATNTAIAAPAKKHTGKQTYNGTVQTNINLNGRGSDKQTFHIEIVAEDVSFEPGDSLGIIPHHKPELVQYILELAGVSGEENVTYRNETVTLSQLLTKKVSLVNIPGRVVKKYAEIVGQDIPETRMDLSDLLRIYPVRDAGQFLSAVQVLDPIAPRLYSIASSPEAQSGEVHILVALHHFNVNGQTKKGLGSSFLAQLKDGDQVEFYIHKNHLFRLPAADKDVIMIGPGTGVAPFRSFVAHRDATGAEGRNWLFFGDQHFTTDFLYQTEWLSWIDTGVLTKMNVAFSRDQQEKVYVQHKLWQHRKELLEWIEGGASIYVCGAREPMSIDVERTLLDILIEQKSLSPEKAVEYLEQLKEEGRYAKDVY
jgi:sulfite reductase (NADPH) flavoprotein alpha-component